MAWFITERLGMLAAVERSCSVGRYQTAAELASSMAGFNHVQGRVDDAERIWRMIIAAAHQADDRAATARAQLRLAAAICGQGRHAEASPIVDQCARAFRELADEHGLATALYWRAACDWNLGGYADARESADRAIHLARATSDRQTEALALRIRAIALANLPDRREEAIASAEQARALISGLRHSTLEHEILHSIAYVYNLTGRHEDALQLGRNGLNLGRELGEQRDWLGLLGDAYHGLGRHSEAAESLREALPFYRDRFMRHALCLLKMGYAYQAMGDYDAAISHLSESLDIFDQLQLAHYSQRARDALTTCHNSWRVTLRPGGHGRDSQRGHS